MNGKTLTINNSVTIADEKTVVVIGEGTLTVAPTAAGSTAIQGGVLVVYGPTVNATGSAATSNGNGGHGIASVLSILSGSVTAQGGNGGASEEDPGGPGASGVDADEVTVTSGTLTAIGGDGGAYTGTDSVRDGFGGPGIYGNVTVNGGTVKAIGGAKGIGGNGTVADSKGIEGTLTLGTGMYLYGADTANPEDDRDNLVPLVEGDYARFKHMTVNSTAPRSAQTITASDMTVAYGDTDKKVTATTDGNGEISYAVKEGSEDYIDVNASTGALTIKKVGKATVIVTAAETSTYKQATKEVTITINKGNAVPATVTANNRTYDGTEKPLVTVTGEATGGTMQYALGNATEATQPYTTSIPTATTAGTYYVWYRAFANENNISETKCIRAEIKAVVLTDEMVTIEPNQYTYDKEKKTPAITVKNGETALVLDTDYTIVAESVTSESAASTGDGYKITVAGKGNYTGSITKYWKIGKAENKVTVAIEGWTYGDTAKTPTAEASDGADKATFTYSDKADGTYTAAVPAKAGKYFVKAAVAESDNYAQGVSEPKEFEIKKAALTIKADAKSIAFGEKDVELTYSVEGLKNDEKAADVLTGALEREEGTKAGTYKIMKGTLTASSNYEIEFTGADYVIAKAANKATVAIEGWTYGETAKKPVATADFGTDTAAYSYSDKADGTYTATVPTNAGKYFVKAAIAGTEDYAEAVSEPKEFEIKKAPLIVKAEAKSINEGDKDVALTYTAEGFKNGDRAETALIGALTREPGTKAGTYKITQGTLAAANYEIAFTGADYVIKAVEKETPEPETKETSFRNWSSKKANITVPSTVTKNGVKYTVTSLKKNAFPGRYVKKVTLPASIKTISAEAFKNDKKLKKITINSKKLTVNKKAFKGLKKSQLKKIKVIVNKKNMSKADFKKLQKTLVKLGLTKKNIVRK